MKFSTHAKKEGLDSAPVIVLPFFEGKEKAEPGTDLTLWKSSFEAPVHLKDFLGKEGETLLLYAKEKRILLLGFGKKQTCGKEQVRRAYASCVKVLRAKKISHVDVLLPEKIEDVCVCAFEGIKLANYTYDLFKVATKKETHPPLEKVCFAPVSKEEKALVEEMSLILDGVHLARDLVNGNADEVNVKKLTSLSLDLAKKYSAIKTDVLDRKKLEKEGLGFILAVNQGATLDPALVIIEYRGNPSSKEKIAILGKGVTYDTGGLNLKPTGSMETMKCDMSGAAATLAVMQVAAELKLKKNIIGVLAIAENAIGPDSYKPGDVICGHAGKTVEINNTDAEGRLVLADALSYVQKEYAPSQLIDLATLTGGIVIALGEEASGLFSNDEHLAKALLLAGERTHERLWRMPLFPEYKDKLKSTIADLKNSGGKEASSATGALFLEQFVQETPWAHLDIAGTAFLSEAKRYHPTHATGVGVRLLINFLQH